MESGFYNGFFTEGREDVQLSTHDKKTKIITLKNSNKISLPFTLLDNGHALVLDELPKGIRNLNILE